MNVLAAAEKISVFRGRRAILKEVSLEIGERDFITVIGPNGAGKSMLLKCLMGFYKPDRGRVTRKKGVRTGYMPQSLTVNQSVPVTVKRFLTLRKRVDREAILRAGKETAVESLLDKPLHALSGGELQRVLLTRALLGEPELLMLDEPAQNLDVSSQLAFYKLMERIYNERQLSILMVSHDLHLVMSCTRRVVCLFHHVCCSGEPQTVAKDPEFISLFGDDTARMMAVYHHIHGHVHDDRHDNHHDSGDHAR